MWTRYVTTAALAGVLLSIPACDKKESNSMSENRTTRDMRQDPNPPGAESADRMFLKTAAQANRAEVETGRLALSKASNSDVRSFAQHMIDDHSKANAELLDLAQKKGFTTPNDLDAEHQKDAARLADLSGADFDRAYMGMMVTDHVKAVALFEGAAKAAKDSDVRAFAEKTAPDLRKHLKMARDLNSKVGGSSTP